MASASCEPHNMSELPAGAKVALVAMDKAAFNFLRHLVGPSPTPIVAQEAAALEIPEDDYTPFLDGTDDMQTPAHEITLVHAVRVPTRQPSFSYDFDVQRTIGSGLANVTGGVIDADWWSTGKVTCHAKWEDCVDDVKLPGPTTVKTSEVAFDLVADAVRVALGQPHQFRDTRAHSVTYSLIAGTRFREYYPKSEEESSFQIREEKPATVIVKNSVRPPKPSIVYIVPAFKWEDGFDVRTHTRVRGRVSVLRMYLERPFCVTGNSEGIGLVLAPAGADDKTRAFASHWGLDPIRKSGNQLGMREIAASDFSGYNISKLKVCNYSNDDGSRKTKPQCSLLETSRKYANADGSRKMIPAAFFLRPKNQ